MRRQVVGLLTTRVTVNTVVLDRCSGPSSAGVSPAAAPPQTAPMAAIHRARCLPCAGQALVEPHLKTFDPSAQPLDLCGRLAG
jgi:hypothetical protein